MRRITITRHVTVRRCVPVVRVRPLPPRPKKPVTVTIGGVTRTYWI